MAVAARQRVKAPATASARCARSAASSASASARARAGDWGGGSPGCAAPAVRVNCPLIGMGSESVQRKRDGHEAATGTMVCCQDVSVLC